jgi:STE24 endopeptidase
MGSVRLCALLVLCLLPGLLAVFAFPATHQPPQSLQATGASDSSHPLLQYTLPPDKLEKAYALYLLNGTLYFVTTAWSFLVLYLMLRTRFGVRLRNLATVSRFRVVQAAIVMSVFVLVLELTQLPFDSYEHHVSLKYGLSVQQWGSWFWDWGKGLLLGFLIASLVGWGLYAVLRHSPRRWWFYFWLGTIPGVIFLIFIAPVWIEPLFNKFEPLIDHHADLVAQIERVVHRGGMDIPPERMFEMKASEKTTV